MPANKRLRVLTVLAPDSETGVAAVWATRQVDSIRDLGVEIETYVFRQRRSLRGLLRGGMEIRRRAREFGADLVHVHYGAAQALMATLFSPVPVIVSYCGSDLLGHYDPNGNRLLSGRLSNLLSQLSALRVRRAIAKSEELRRALWWPWVRKRCEVIPNGVNLVQFMPQPRAEARAALGWDHDDPVVLFINRRGAWVKDPDLAHAAFEEAKKAVPSLQLHVVENEPADRIPLFLNAADALIITSRHEGSSNAVKEAMACNLPVISTACGDVPERLRGVRHCHVCARDPKELGARLAEVVALRERSDGRGHIAELGLESVANRVRGYYETARRPLLSGMPFLARAVEGLSAPAGMRARRIVYVTTSLPYDAGEAFIIAEIKELIWRGRSVLVVPRTPRRTVIHEDARPLLDVTATKGLLSGEIMRAALGELLRNPGRVLGCLGLVLWSRKPRSLVTNLAVFPKSLWLGRLAREWEADHIHAHWAMTPATMALVASEISGVPWSFTAHRGDIVESNLLPLKMERASFARFISQSGLQMARNLGVDCPANRARVIHMGVEIPEWPVRDGSPSVPRHAPVKESFIVVCPANLLPVKGHAHLIDAFALLMARNRNATLWIAGQGPLRRQLEQQVADLNLTHRVVFLGQLSHAALLRHYEEGAVDLVVLPSVDLGNGLHEGIPVSLMEAMSYGLPVVSTTTGGIPELLGGGAGVLVPPQDAQALADAIERVMTEPVWRDQIARAGRRRVEEDFAVEKIAEELIACFESARLCASSPLLSAASPPEKSA